MASRICSNNNQPFVPAWVRSKSLPPPPLQCNIILPAKSTNIHTYFEHLNWGQAKNIYRLFNTERLIKTSRSEPFK